MKLDKKKRLLDGKGCNCDSEAEHQALVRAVDESFKKDNERAKMRQRQNSEALRAHVLYELSKANGDLFPQ